MITDVPWNTMEAIECGTVSIKWGKRRTANPEENPSSKKKPYGMNAKNREREKDTDDGKLRESDLH